jgi:thiazole synthase
VRRTNIGQNADEPNILDVLPMSEFTYLPNTAGCYDVETAVRTCRLARELLDGHDLVKLEVLGDEKTLFPDVIATLKAAETLAREGFKIMVYTNDDPIVARQLEEIGCVAVMPLAAPIGSGLGFATSSTFAPLSRTPVSRCWSMPASVPRPMRPWRWNWDATAC